MLSVKEKGERERVLLILFMADYLHRKLLHYQGHTRWGDRDLIAVAGGSQRRNIRCE